MANEPTAEMRRLTSDAIDQTDALMMALKNDEISVDEWEESMQELLTSYHSASYMTGIDSGELSPGDLQAIKIVVKEQLVYLENFALVIQSSDEFFDAWFARAAMYPNAFTRTYWEGVTKGIPVPAQPAQGTNCLSNCRCSWRIETVSSDNGDYDCYWELDPFVEEGNHCQTCLERNDQWYPVLVRDGILQV